MHQKNPSLASQSSPDATHPELEGEDELSEDFLKQNEAIAQEIWKHDKDLYCPKRTFIFLIFFFSVRAIGTLLYHIFDDSPGDEDDEDDEEIIFDYIGNLEVFLGECITLISIWACIQVWKAINSKDTSKLEKSISVFKVFLAYSLGFEVPLLLYVLRKIDWELDFSLWWPIVLNIMLSTISVLFAIRVKNILVRNKPFYEASSFAYGHA